jgi:antitoxin component YwqK of YwqJK toxin-antitoxin module
MAGVMGAIFFAFLGILLYIKYVGLTSLDSNGDQALVASTITAVFLLLLFGFPLLIWFFLYRFGSLKMAGKPVGITSLILFAALPLWVYWSWGALSELQSIYSGFRSVRDQCTIQDGMNRRIVGGNTQEFECRNGVLNGPIKTYTPDGILIYEGSYLNGKQNASETAYYDDGKVKSSKNYKDGVADGIQVFYNQDGNTNLYLIVEQGKTHWVYYQSPEGSFYGDLDSETQSYFCKNQKSPSLKNYRYTCLNNVLDGEFIRYDAQGKVEERGNFVNGVLDGIYEQFSRGKLMKHLEFKNGKLDGKVQIYTSEDRLTYEGQYANGLQNGIFRRYDYEGNLQSEVVFEQSQLIKINKLSPASQS